MIAGIPTETFPGERRVSITPGVIPTLTKAGLEVLLEAGAGQSAGFTDTAYLNKGARVATNRADVFGEADIILQVRTPGANPTSGQPELDLFRPDHTVIGFSDPLSEPSLARDLGSRGVTCFSMELIPRITRAQSMDALSSMATIAGYKAVIVAAERLPRMFPMMMTAAGTVTPARVFVVGAGVAGLQAIASARRLGAKVEAYDVRPAVKEQVESLGATFVDLPLDTDGSEDAGGYAKTQDQAFYARQQAMMSRVVESSDVVITTALIPGRQAPVLITDEMIAGMAAGAVVVDLAAERGGNVEPSLPDQVVIAHDVTVLGPTNLPASVPHHASQMYAKNVSTFLLHLLDDGKVRLNLDDEITQSTLVCHGGQVVHPRVRELLAPHD
ncbi:MAG: Re/Si-specific NAD(P)(+) transhydrogenase subunit alpha [Acidobacteriota bacterium]|nr:Re/Si-specific NAD(P)(+) transhydrogenase subunit alpha [Acidobacteriota bacterium]